MNQKHSSISHLIADEALLNAGDLRTPGTCLSHSCRNPTRFVEGSKLTRSQARTETLGHRETPCKLQAKVIRMFPHSRAPTERPCQPKFKVVSCIRGPAPQPQSRLVSSRKPTSHNVANSSPVLAGNVGQGSEDIRCSPVPPFRYTIPRP